MLISIIIPYFNVDINLLTNCLNSIEKQTYQLYEVIFINDGSMKLTNVFFEKYDKISYFFQENLGVSVARNLGIKKARGEYIIFVDPDDYLPLNTLESFVQHINRNNKPDICVSRSGSVINQKIIEPKPTKEELISKRMLIKSVLNHQECIENFSSGSPWSKAFKKSFLISNNLFFLPSLKKSQDRIFMLYCYEKANNVSFMNINTYYYRSDNKYSVCNKANESIDIILKNVIDEVEKFIQKFYENDIELNEAFLYFKISCLFNSLKLKYISMDIKKSSYFVEVDDLKKFIYKNDYIQIINSINFQNFNYNRKIIMILIRYRQFWVFPFLKKIRKIIFYTYKK